MARVFPLDTTAGRKRVIGVVLFVLLFGVFFSQNRFPKLDTVREDFAIAVDAAERAAEDLPALEANGCFQGFCVDPEAPLLERWWEFSIIYLELVTVGMIFAFLVAGLSEALIFSKGGGGAFGRRSGIVGSLQGLTVGPAMTLCSACIVPVANSMKKQGADVEATVAITQGSSTLNGPAMIMVFAMFTPLLAGSRVVLSVIGALFLGPFVAWAVYGRRHREHTVEDRLGIAPAGDPPEAWPDVILGGMRDWIAASFRFLVRLGPIMVVAGFISGLAIQFLTPDVVSRLLGNHLLGIALAATLGVLINVPLLFEIPLVGALMLLGMGTAPAAVLLFAAAAGGPITFWGLKDQIGRRGVTALAGGTWALGALGGVVLLVFGLTPAAEQTPVIAFDGTTCSYEGPGTIAAEPTRFAVRNDTTDDGRDLTLAIVVGRIPDDIGYDRFVSDVLASPRSVQPAYFRIAGEHDFVFPQSTQYTTVVLHTPGTYAAVCLFGGGPYVVTEFSMPQPADWFDEFRDQFTNSVSGAFVVGG